MPQVLHIDGDINTPFPEEKFQAYLKTIGASSEDKLTQEQAQLLLVMAISDFKTGKLGLDELADMGDIVWTREESKLTDLARASYACAELTFTVRRVTASKEATMQFVDYIADAFTYYEAYKYLLEEKTR